jgi:hypothetical protein
MIAGVIRPAPRPARLPLAAFRLIPDLHKTVAFNRTPSNLSASYRSRLNL